MTPLFTFQIWNQGACLSNPTTLFSPKALGPYEHAVEIAPYEKHTLIKFFCNDEEGDGWIDEEDCTSVLDNLLPLRESLIYVDPRSLYLTLLAHRDRIQDDDKRRNRAEYLQSLSIPTNLKKLDHAHQTLVTFFEISSNVLEAVVSAIPESEESLLDIKKLSVILSRLTLEEKDTWLSKFLEGDSSTVFELRNRLQTLQKGT